MNKFCRAGSAVIAGFILGSGLVDALPAKAVEIGVGDQSGIYDYLNAGQTGLVNLDLQLDEDEDGNRSTRVKIYALQSLAFSEQSAIYDQLDFSAAPDTVTVSGSGASGMYRTEDGGDVKPVTIFTMQRRQGNTGAFINAEDFTFSVAAPGNYYTDVTQNAGSSDRIGWSVVSYNLGGDTATRELVGTGIGASVSMAPYVNYSTHYFGMYNERIPTINAVSPLYASSSSPAIIGGLAETVTLPPGTIDTENPWDYYNNILLPYMEEEFPGYDEYFVFPDGYTAPEPPPQVPTEYPTLPGWEFDPVQDGTLPAGADNIAYQMPETPIKRVPVPSFDLTKINPAEIIAPFAESFRGIWDLIADILVSFDLLPVVSLCFLVLILCAFLALGVK